MSDDNFSMSGMTEGEIEKVPGSMQGVWSDPKGKMDDLTVTPSDMKQLK